MAKHFESSNLQKCLHGRTCRICLQESGGATSHTDCQSVHLQALVFYPNSEDFEDGEHGQFSQNMHGLFCGCKFVINGVQVASVDFAEFKNSRHKLCENRSDFSRFSLKEKHCSLMVSLEWTFLGCP